MALIINDRVKVNSTATGNSQTTFAIDNTPVTGFETFNTGIGVGNTTNYCIFNQGTSEFEVGLGTLSSTTNLQRTQLSPVLIQMQLLIFNQALKMFFVQSCK